MAVFSQDLNGSKKLIMATQISSGSRRMPAPFAGTEKNFSNTRKFFSVFLPTLLPIDNFSLLVPVRR